MNASIRTPVHPTEDPEKVRTSVLNIFPHAELTLGNGCLLGTVSDLERFLVLIRDQRIRDTAVSVLRASLEGDRTRFTLHKQVAFASKVNFTEGRSTLGDIEVEVMEGAIGLIERAIPPPDTTVQHHLNTHPANDGDDELEVL